MRRNATIAIALFVLLWTGVRFVFAQSNAIIPVPYVYRIDVKGCEFEPKNRRQTGFRVEGTTGIVTALHGVADCTLIDATADGGQEKYTQLTIRQVDIAHDVVVLSSPSLDELPADGLAVSPLSITEILTASLRIVGYPRGLEDQDIDVIESIRDIESLDDVIPDAEEPAAFIKRKSPDLNIQVLNVQAQLLPGHSGAPLIDSEDRVVAIGNGGLRGGSDSRSWAILWSADNLQSVELDGVQARLAELAEKDITALSFSSTFPSQVDDAVGVKPYTVQVIDAGDSQPIANAEVLLTHSAGYEIGVTDSEGFYTFRLADDDGLDYAESQLQVEAVGYVSYSRSVPNVLARVGPEKVRLDVVEATTTVPPLEKTETSLCAFAFLILDEVNEQPIARAMVSVTLGTAPAEGQTDSRGYYGSQLPCNDRPNATIRVRVTAPGYQPHTQTVVLIDETKEILLNPVTSEASASPATELVVTVALCNVRSGPGTDNSIIGTVSAGEKFITVGISSDKAWWQIKLQEQSSWISDTCVKVSESLTPISTVTPLTTSIQPLPGDTFEQKIENVSYKIVEVKQEADGISVWIVARNEGLSAQSAICSYANGNLGFCHFLDDAGNSYDGTYDNRTWKFVILPNDAPFRFKIKFPARDVNLISVLEIPVSGGLVAFHNVPIPYVATESETKPVPVPDMVNQDFEQTIDNVSYQLVEVKEETGGISVSVVAKNKGVSAQSAICSYANGKLGFCRFFDDEGNSYDGTYDKRTWKFVTLPSNAPFRFEVRFPALAIKNMSVLEIPVSGGRVEFHNVPVPYKFSQ